MEFEWLSELLQLIAAGLMIISLLVKLIGTARASDFSQRLKRTFSHDWNYPGGRLMRIIVWCRHPLSQSRCTDAASDAGWNWPDPEDDSARIGWS